MDPRPPFSETTEVRKKMKVWVERHPKMRNLHGSHYYLKIAIWKDIFKISSAGVHWTGPSLQRVTKSLFLRYKKISKKPVKLRCFLQCLVHIFLGHNGCVWKINLKILYSLIVKNFQVKHGKCGSIIFPQNIFFGRL